MADEVKTATAEMNFSIEVNCPHCGSRNRYHQLSAVHTNTRTNLNKGKSDFALDAKCESCSKYYQIAKIRY